MPAKETTEITFKHLLEYCNRVSPDVHFMEYKENGGITAKTYRQFKTDADTLSRYLTDSGFAGAHIAMVGGACYQWPVAFLGTVNTSAAAVPLAPAETDEMNTKLFFFADCTVLFFDKKHRSLYESVKAQAEGKMLYISLDGETDEPDVVSLPEILSHPADGYDRFPAPDDLCAIMFTSGTTGFPKGVMLTHKNFMYAGMSVHNAYPTQRMLGCLPFHHAFGLTGNITKTMVNSRTLCINDNLQNLLADFRLYKPNGMLAVPQIVKYVMFSAIKYAETKKDTMSEHDAVQEFLGGGMIDIACGAAPLEADIDLRFNATGININNGYGMTECAPIVANNVEGHMRPGSVGRPIPCVQAKIEDGEILLKGPNVMQGYYKNTQATKEAFTEDGWFRTGDLGRPDEDGYLFITGRKKNLILLDNGENVSAEFLEAKFATEKAVKEVMCYGENGAIYAEIYPDAEYLTAQAVSDTEIYIQTLIERVNRQLTGFQHISGFILRDIPFIRTASGKIKRAVPHGKVSKKIVAPVSAAEKKVAAAVCDVLSMSEVSMTDNFFAIGGNSLNAVELAVTLHVEPQCIYDHSFLQSLAQAVELYTKSETQRQSDINRLIAQTQTDEVHPAYKTVLLTGATGFLGVHILKELTDRGLTVYCLVRSEKKLSEQIAYYHKEINTSLIHAVIGDIEKPNLGLENKEYDSLCDKIDTVFHTAANVHHAGDYADLERTNVIGTQNVIAFCKKSGAVLQHTSTVSVHGAATVIETHENQIFDETKLDIGQKFTDNVYIHSKYCAEEAVLLARKDGIKANIYRIGNLTWRASDGLFQRNAADNGFLHRLHAILKLGLYHENMDKYPMDLTAVDECADAYVRLALTGGQNKIFHMFNDNFLDVRDLFTRLQLPYRVTSTAEAIELSVANQDDRDIHVYLFYMIISGRSSEVDMVNEQTKRELQTLGFTWGQPDRKYLTVSPDGGRGHCLDYEKIQLRPVRTTGGTLTPIGKLTLGVLRDTSPKTPEIIEGVNKLYEIPQILNKLGVKKPLFVTVSFAMPGLQTVIDEVGAPVFKGIAAEPTVTDTENALRMYTENNCDSVVAVGGGSVLDTAKITALCAANPGADMEDICKADSDCNPCVPFIAVPTTAGTGSEVTLFAVVTEEDKNRKKPFTSDKFQPDVIILDAQLTVSVPPKNSAYMGIDALSHAVESQLSLFAPSFPEDAVFAPVACKRIFTWLPVVCREPGNLQARAEMQKAALEAGQAFGRIGTGYIHAVAHRFGEFCHVPHGLAIAKAFTVVLRAYLPYGADKLAELFDVCDMGDRSLPVQEKANLFIDDVDALIRALDIDTAAVPIREEDIPEMARKAQEEAKIIGYPRPFTDEEVRQLIGKM